MSGEDSGGKKRKKMPFVDDIAVDEDDSQAGSEDEGDEQYEPEAGDDDIEDDRGASKRARLNADGRTDFDQDSAFHQSVDQLLDQQEDANIQQMLKQKYGESNEQEIDLKDLGEGQEPDDLRPAAGLFPSMKDPKLWLVGCEKDTEEKAVLAIIQKAQRVAGTPEQLYIQSVFTTPASKKYIYIEAYKQDHVKRAVAGIRYIFWWKIRLVPINEMKDAVSLHQQRGGLRIKQWVRIKAGLYKFDLAQVVMLEDQDTRVTVKLIPRIDKGAVTQEAKAREEGEEAAKKWRAEHRKRKPIRPLPALFDKKEIEELGGEVFRKTSGNDSGYDIYKNQKFRHGFLHRTLGSSAILIDCAPPTQDELERFNSRGRGASGSDEEPDQNNSFADQKKAAEFQKDDRVRVITGDTKNLTGRVLGVYKSTLHMMPDPKWNIHSPHSYRINEVVKYFNVGDHIKVIGGKERGETGLILQVLDKDDAIVLYSDVSAREIQVPSADVIESTAVSAGNEQLGNFELYDLVHLNQNNQVGVIVKVEVGSFKVMILSGDVITAKLQDIDKKRSSNLATCLDSQGNLLQTRDVVRVVLGPCFGRSGPIKHIQRDVVFIYSRLIPDYSGISAVPARHCLLSGQPLTKPMTPASPGSFVAEGRSRPDKKLVDLRRDPMLDQPIVIIRGQWKGLKGVVSVATDLNFSIALSAICKKITLPRTHVALSATPDSEIRRDTGEATLLSSRTPQHLGGATPSRSYDGGVTPARTPTRDTPRTPARTPSRDVWLAMTPRRDGGASPLHVPQSPASQTNDADADDEDTELYNRSWGSAAQTDTKDSEGKPGSPHSQDPGSGDDEVLRSPLSPPSSPAHSTPPRDNIEPPAPAPRPRVFVIGIAVRPVAQKNPDDSDDDESEGVITEVNESTITVLLNSGGSKTEDTANWETVTPSKNDMVYITSEERKGEVGKLIGIDSEDGIVRMQEGDLAIVPLPSLVKFRDSDT